LHASISDSGDLSDWLEENPDAVSDLFNSTNGVATRIVALLEPYTESYGIIDDRKEVIGDSIGNIDKRITRLEERMERREAYYRRQFAALQESISLINFQQSVITNITNQMTNYPIG